MRAFAAALGLSLLALSAPKCPPPIPPTPSPSPSPPGPVCTVSGQCDCYVWDGSAWARTPCAPPSDPPPALDCPMGSGTGEGAQCHQEGSVYSADVYEALSSVVVQHPEWFDLHDCQGDRCRVRAPFQTAYHDAACAALRARGLCCEIMGGYEEIAIKSPGQAGLAFGEGYDILSGTGYMLRSYRGTCRPAWFAGGGPVTPPSTPPSAPPSTPPSVPPSAPPSTPPSPPPVSVPAEPVPFVQPAGACSGGTRRMPYELGGSVCIAESACVPAPGTGDKCTGLAEHPESAGGDLCIVCEAQLNYHTRWGRAKMDAEGFAVFSDGPEKMYRMDAYCRPMQVNGRLFGTWSTRPLYARWNEVCRPVNAQPPVVVSPPPTPGPSTPPTPQPGATPGPPCPPVVAIAANVAQHQTPEHQTWPHLWGLVNGSTNLDSTPKFLRDCPRCSSNNEHHNQTTVDLDAHQHTLQPDPSDPSRLVCVTWRHCEDQRGSEWAQMGGPAVAYHVTNGDEGRGFGLNIGPFTAPGTYTFRVTVPHDWRDASGCSVPVSGNVFADVEFEVRNQ